jgi:tetratricopeptide (TPR) repeat protein
MAALGLNRQFGLPATILRVLSLAVLVACLTFTQFANAQLKSLDGECVATKINEALMNEEPELALKITQQCIDGEKAVASTVKGQRGFHGSIRTDDAILNVGNFLCFKAQIQSLTGDSAGALKSIREAEEFSQQWSTQYYTDLWDWPGVLNLTKAFRLERAGQSEEAKKSYGQSLTAHAFGRLAAMALRENDDQNDRFWAQKALEKDPHEPAASYVLGRMLERDNKPDDALLKYQSALADMKNPSDRSPIKVAEAQRVKEAIARIEANRK